MYQAITPSKIPPTRACDIECYRGDTKVKGIMPKETYRYYSVIYPTSGMKIK